MLNLLTWLIIVVFALGGGALTGAALGAARRRRRHRGRLWALALLVGLLAVVAVLAVIAATYGVLTRTAANLSTQGPAEFSAAPGPYAAAAAVAVGVAVLVLSGVAGRWGYRRLSRPRPSPLPALEPPRRP